MAEIKDPENTIVMETTKGRVVIQLLPDLAPGHVARIKELTREGAYDGVVFHRVIEDFMAQTGDVQYGKTGGKDYTGLAMFAEAADGKKYMQAVCIENK